MTDAGCWGWNAMTYVGAPLEAESRSRASARPSAADTGTNRTVENGEADDQGTTPEFDPAVGAGPPTEINAGEGCVLNAQTGE